MNKFYLYIICFLLSTIVLLGIFEIPIPSKVTEPRVLNNYEIISFFILCLIIFIYTKYFHKEQRIRYSKCPKCKESFNYSELEKGKCKYCKDVDTIDIEEYYKKYPEELEKI